MTVYFIGAGPGDPELITVKGQRLIETCAVVLYAGSLVPDALLAYARQGALIADTSNLHLQQIIDQMQVAHDNGHDVARLHSGDPSLYGAIGEQMRHLKKRNIPYQIIPGVTSTSASAAALQQELTLSGVSQTVILTRYGAKTPMPEKENLTALAQHGATLAIHLSVVRIHKIVEELIPFYGEHCPVAVVYRASWPDEQKIVGTLADIVAKVRENKINRTALILVGQVLAEDEPFSDSYLYDKDQSHIYRRKMKG